MPDTPPYSEATVELVAAAIASARDDDVFTEVEWNGSHWDGLRDAYRADARASLDALAAAGLLATGRQYGVDTGSYLLSYDTREEAEERLAARAAVRAYEHPGTLVSRPVGEWSPAPPKES